jgi:hypothetical protein
MWGGPHRPLRRRCCFMPDSASLPPPSMPLQLFTYGKGDDTASWAVTDYSIVSYVSGQSVL